MLSLQNQTDNTSFNTTIDKVIDTLLIKFDKKSTVVVVLVNKATIKALNKDYRNKNVETNVLSFPSEVPKSIDDILGDIVICLEVLEEQAIAEQKPLKDHLTHIIIHGFLHLLDYSHIEENEAKKMEDLEVNILQNFGIKNPYLV